VDDSDSLWLPLAFGSRIFDLSAELWLLEKQICDLLPGSPAARIAEQFVIARPGDRIEIGHKLVQALRAVRDDENAERIRELREFTQLLLACLGDRDSASDVALNLTRRACCVSGLDAAYRRTLIQAAVGWLAVASGKQDPKFEGQISDYASGLGYELAEVFASSAIRRLREIEAKRKAREQAEAEQKQGLSVDEAVDAVMSILREDRDTSTAGTAAEETLVVVSAVAQGTGGRDIGVDFDAVNSRALPLVRTPDLGPVRYQLAGEFPHAAHMIDAILADLAGRRSVRLRPTLLVGDPGGGKSRLARRLCELLGVPSAIYPCGGASDSSIAGTARRWSSSEPSMPLRMVRDHEIANPAIVLDELEKAASGRGTNGGRLWDALVQLTEIETAARYEDPYVQAPVDLSAVIWLATANSLDHVPEPLLDRFRVLRVPSPMAEHLPALAASIMRDLVRERGLDACWATPLDGLELRALRRAWKGGSLRVLRRLVEGVLAARDQAAPRH